MVLLMRLVDQSPSNGDENQNGNDDGGCDLVPLACCVVCECAAQYPAILFGAPLKAHTIITGSTPLGLICAPF